jgi:hypothetical protein
MTASTPKLLTALPLAGLVALALATAAPADDDPPAPPLPIVTTGGVAGFDVGNATVTGTINPNGSAATCRVEYGPTTEYDESKFCDSSPSGGTDPVAVQALLTGLVPGQTIHYRFVATNDGGTAMGDDQTLLTPAIVGSQAPTGSGDSGGSGGASGGSGGSSGGSGGATASAKLVLPASARIVSGRVRLTLRCSGAPCRGKVKLTARAGGRTFTAGTIRVALTAGQSVTATVRLTATARAQLRRHRSLTVTARGAGASTTIRVRG